MGMVHYVDLTLRHEGDLASSAEIPALPRPGKGGRMILCSHFSVG